MNRNARLALAILMSATLPVCLSAQTPEKVDPWVPTVDARANTERDAVVIHKGAVRTNRLYSDFVFMFEFQLQDARSQGNVLVRSRFGYGGSPTLVRGYRIALTSRAEGKDGLGRVVPAEMHMKEVAFEPVRALRASGEWQEGEVRAERDTLSVTINGTVVSTIPAHDDGDSNPVRKTGNPSMSS